MLVDRSLLRFIIVPTRHYPDQFKAQCTEAYLSWKNIWSKVLTEEMNVGGVLHSDGFSRHSHLAMLYYGEELACMTTLNVLNLNDPVTLDDSYFQVWPETSLMRVRKEADSVLACCNLALSYQFRKGAMNVRWKDLMFAVLVQYINRISVGGMVATVRLEKGMHEAAYRTGAIAIARDIPYSIPGRRIDIVLWKKNLSVAGLDPEINALVDYICQNSLITYDYVVNQRIKHAA